MILGITGSERREAQVRAAGELAVAFGFADRSAMFDYLAKSRTHSCAKRGCYLLPKGQPSYHFDEQGDYIDGGGVDPRTRIPAGTGWM